MIPDQAIQDIGSRLAELPEDLREQLATLIGAGIEGLDYMAEDLDYRADFERRHSYGGSPEEEEYGDGSDEAGASSSQLSRLLSYLRDN